jgi:uncharacterized membrane protein YphA (DoxX/SURF4 family)
MIAQITVSLISLILAALWTYSSFDKWQDMKRFRHAMTVQAFPVWAGNILAWILPPMEMFIAVLLLLNTTKLLGLYLSFVFMVIFTIYVSGIVFKIYKSYPCPCGGIFTYLGWKKHFRINVVLTLLALIGILISEFIR